MPICKQHRQRPGNAGMTCGTGQFYLIAERVRALFFPLCMLCLSMIAGPGWAVNPPDVRILTEPMSHEISSRCSNLGNLMTLTRAVQNFGGPLRANRYYLYVSEITDTYTHGKDLDAHLHSRRYYLPAMPAQGQGQPVQLTMVVGTTASFSKKIPGPHVLLIHLVEDGVDANSIYVVGDPVVTVRFSPGYCQPRRLMSPSQMQLQRNNTVQRRFGSGLHPRARLVKPVTGAMASKQPGLHIPPPKIQLASETHYVHLDCKNMDNLVTFILHLHNAGGPLAGHKLEAWIEDDQGVLPYNGVAHEKWLPPLVSGQTATVTIPVGVLPRNIGQLPGAHDVAIGYYTGATLASGIRTISRKHVSIMLPQNICQPKLRLKSPTQMHLKRGGIKPLNAKPDSTTTVHRLRLPAVQ